MSDQRLEGYLRRIRREFPDYIVAARPYQSPDDETIAHFLHLLDVPEDDLGPATRRALEIAFDAYGEDPLPFHLTTVDPETSRKFFPKEFEAARSGARDGGMERLFVAASLSETFPPLLDWSSTSSLWEATSSGAPESWDNLEWTRLPPSHAPENHPAPAADPKLAGSASTVRPLDPSESGYPLAA